MATEASNGSGAGYGKDDPFRDPVVRCLECQNLLDVQQLLKGGCCTSCGCRRVRNVLTMNAQEYDWCQQREVDPDFLALFEVADDAA